MTPDRFYELSAWIDQQQAEIASKNAEIERLRAAIRDAHALIDNDLVGPWVAAHKLDDILR